MSSIFRSENGTEYFPYESVYAVGEIKATYSKSKKPIPHFVETRERLSALTREDVPANYIRAHSGGFYLGAGLTSADRAGKQNNLFSFMLFAGSGDFEVKDVAKMYSCTPPRKLPNVVCLLDKGIITYTQFDKFSPSDGSYQKVSFLALPDRPTIEKDRRFAWTLYSNGENETRALS